MTFITKLKQKMHGLQYELQKSREIEIPIYCPFCSAKLYHVNAIDSEAKIYFVYCMTLKCRYCKEWRIIDGILKEM